MSKILIFFFFFFPIRYTDAKNQNLSCRFFFSLKWQEKLVLFIYLFILIQPSMHSLLFSLSNLYMYPKRTNVWSLPGQVSTFNVTFSMQFYLLSKEMVPFTLSLAALLLAWGAAVHPPHNHSPSHSPPDTAGTQRMATGERNRHFLGIVQFRLLHHLAPGCGEAAMAWGWRVRAGWGSSSGRLCHPHGAHLATAHFSLAQ